MIVGFAATSGFGQSVPEGFANNDAALAWEQITTSHFQIVFPYKRAWVSANLASRAEQIYEEYKRRMGVAPPKVTIYYKNDSTLVSGRHALDIGKEYSVWDEDLLAPDHLQSTDLRTEIGYAFTEYAKRFPLAYWHYPFWRSSNSPWSDGWISYLAHPGVSLSDLKFEHKYYRSSKQWKARQSLKDTWFVLKMGRSQIRYFVEIYGYQSLKELYTTRQSLLGIASYFDFTAAFKQATGISYEVFKKHWSDSKRAPTFQPDTAAKALKPHPTDGNDTQTELSVSSYNAFLNTRWEPPFVIPYYHSADDFGLGLYLRLKEPMRTHEFELYGLISVAEPLYKSYFYSQYINNSFRPQLKISYNQLGATEWFEWIGKLRKVQQTNVVAISSLWKLNKISHNFSDWYAGFMLRYMAFNYWSPDLMQLHHPQVFLSNRKTQQTDLRLMLSWRSLKPSKHNFIHPTSGKGLRFIFTGSEKVLGSQVSYARLSLDGYHILPAFGDQRILLYANGVIDLGEPAGRDYLSFADNGDYQLPGPDFMASVNPGVDRFIRGYKTPLLGDRFLFGKMEYRIPFQFETTRELLGFIPPARTSLTFFADAGVMGNAWLSSDRRTTEYRYSVGVEVKRVLSFGGSFKLTYELGLGQPLDQPFGPQPYFNINTALPF